MRIQHNIMAMNAYRNYNTNTSALSKNLEKLSSGYKINRAGDDAAGLAISEKMRAQITGLNAAQKNVKDGISLVKTAEGAMQEIQDMLNRMDYLATQSANGTYDNEVDRANLQKEVDALRTEINRIADSANFNGINLLDGTQAGVKASGAWTETIDPVDVQGMDRILTTLLGKNEKPYDANNTKTVLDSYAPAATKASFEIDLSKLSFSAYDVTASTGSISGASLGSINIEIGGNTFTIKGSQITGASITITNGSAGSISGLNANSLATAFVNSQGTKATSGLDIGGVKWKVEVSGNKLKFTQKSTPKTEAEGKADFSVNVSYTAGSSTKASIKLTGDVNPGTENTKLGVPDDAARRASTVFKMEKTDIVDGATLTLGNKTYTLKVGQDSKVTATTDVIDMSSLGDDFTLDQALTKIANTVQSFTTSDNVTFKVGVSNDTNHPGISVIRQSNPTSVADAQKYDTLEELAKVFSLKHGGGTVEHDAVKASGGLTLQIGDTSDEFNQMTVNIGDMHVNAMGFDLDKKGNITKDGTSIADIDISSQEGAKNAVNTIKNAINYVSSIRGDLGAIQNRLEHTANNLSVMAENIQDAESTIRDTDVAEEMMAYTKNNILVQSAQAMLAQANAVPQGVLQLLG